MAFKLSNKAEIWIIIVISILAPIFFFYNRSHAPTTPEITESLPVPVPLATCGLTVQSPLTNETVAQEFLISVVVDNRDHEKRECVWTVFEAQAGVAEAKDSSGHVLGMSLITTTNDWMTTDPVEYTGKITLSKVPADGKISLTITEDNISGEGVTDSLTYTLNVK